MSFLRRFRDAKSKTIEESRKLVVENIIGALSSRAAGDCPLWSSVNPCPLTMLSELYAKYVSRWPKKVNPDLFAEVSTLWQVSDLKGWLAGFDDLFRIVETSNGVAVVYVPQATDVMVECYYQQHKFSISFYDVEPSLFWNKCPTCGQVNNDEKLKYSILCSATNVLVSKWCGFFSWPGYDDSGTGSDRPHLAAL